MARSVLEKLGFKPGMSIRVTAVPPELEPALMSPEGAPPVPPGSPTLVLVFLCAVAEVEGLALPALAAYRPGDRVWFCYPKKTGHIRTDINRDVGWEALRARDWVAVTQIALDDTWSALRFRPRAEIKVMTRKF